MGIMIARSEHVRTVQLPCSPFSSWPPLPFFIGVAINFLHSLIASHMIWSTSACNQGWACYCLPLRTGGYRLLAFLLRFSFNTPFPWNSIVYASHATTWNVGPSPTPLRSSLSLASLEGGILSRLIDSDRSTATVYLAIRLASCVPFFLFFVLGFSPQQGISTADFAVMFVV